MSHAPLIVAAPARPKGPFARAVAALSITLGVIAALMIFASVLLTCWMIWLRFVMGQSTIWQTEAVIYMMIGSTLLGLPYVQLLRGHVNVDLVPNMLAPAARRALMAGVLVLTLIVVGVMALYGWEMFHMAWSRGWRSDTVWGAPLWVPYLAMPIGFGGYILQLLADLWSEAMEDR